MNRKKKPELAIGANHVQSEMWEKDGVAAGVAEEAQSTSDSLIPSLAAKLAARLTEARKHSRLSRSQAAMLMGLLPSTLSEIEEGKRRPGRDDLHAFAKFYRVSLTWLLAAEEEGLEESAGGNAGVRKKLAARNKVSRALHTKAKVESTKAITGDETADFVGMLESGKTLVEAVMELRITIPRAKHLATEWLSIRGGMFISGETLQAIDNLGFDGPSPIRSDAELLEVMRLASEGALCGVCNKKPRTLCERCAVRAGKRASIKQTESADDSLLSTPRS